MTKEELAKLLNGKEYRTEISSKLLLSAKQNGLVIVYGFSDDLMELEGALEDEFSCYGGGVCLIDSYGIVPDLDMMEDVEDDDEAMEAWYNRRKSAKKIEALRCLDNEPRWTYKTKIPHATFNVMDGGDIQCRGLVFNITDL